MKKILPILLIIFAGSVPAGDYGHFDFSMLAYGVNPYSGGNSIPVPSGWTWDLPFDVFKNGSVYSISPGWDLEEYADITVSKTYYVKMASEGGSDAASGADEAHALANLGTALNKSDVDKIMIKAGEYNGAAGWNNKSPARNLIVKGYGGDVISTFYVAGLTWNGVSTHYRAYYATSVSGVVDFKNLDAYGDGVQLVCKTSSALVNSTAGTWYYNATTDTIYVHTLDSREPDADITCYQGSTNGRKNDAVVYYIEGINFYGGTRGFLSDVSSTGGKLFMKNCEIKYSSNATATDGLSISGNDEVILENMDVSRNGGDGIKLQNSGAVSPKLAMINCEGHYNGIESLNYNNGYSRHGPGTTIAINCTFSHSYGPNFADITDGTVGWFLGCTSISPQSSDASIGFAIDNVVIFYLDGCVSLGASTADLRGYNAGSIIYYRHFTPSSPASSGSGKIIAY